MIAPTLGALLHACLADELPVQKGLRPASIKTHRDALRLFLTFVAADVPCRLTQISIDALTRDRVVCFLLSSTSKSRGIIIGARATTDSRSYTPSLDFSPGGCPRPSTSHNRLPPFP